MFSIKHKSAHVTKLYLNRSLVLGSLAGLTILFLLGAAAYAHLGDIPQVDARVGGLKAASFPKGNESAALRLAVNETGITAVTAEQLRTANFRFDTLSPATISLSRNGDAVPFLVKETATGSALYFYAQAITNTLEAPAIYLLQSGEGLAMAQLKSPPSGKGTSYGTHWYRWEENSSLLTQTNSDDIWFGPLLLAPHAWKLSLDTIRPTNGPGSLTIQLWSSTQDIPDPDHHVAVALNGRSLTNWYWDGIREETIELDIPQDTFAATADNLLTIAMPGDTGATGEALYLDWIQLAYESELTTRYGQVLFGSSADNLLVHDTSKQMLIFDISNAAAPTYLYDYVYLENQVAFAGTGSNRTYAILEPDQALVPEMNRIPQWEESLRSTTHGADYLAIIADVNGFGEAIQPLLALRQQQGLRVTAVSITQIYDEFGYGQQTTNAIRDFLAYTAANWQPPAPRYVLLVGDASYDLLNTANSPNKNLLPTALVKLNNDWGDEYIASDTWFTIFDGETPQMAIGRFPAQTLSELTAMVQKTVDYETAVTTDLNWANNVLLVADDEPLFDTISDQFAATLKNDGYFVHELHMSVNENIHYEIMSAINQGVGLVSYVGHGGPRMWGDEAVFHADDAAMLTNATRLPIFATFTCLNGAFADPEIDSLAETLLGEAGGGAVVAIAPSGRVPLSLNDNANTTLSQAFYQVYTGNEAATIGDVLLLAKQEQTAVSTIHLFNLLGDPALRFHQP
ncbi:MAG: hypothetical protein KC443_15495 [Anaerolineales bacterium]|nr:hypothetical protein [Anaerolineales bacterium]